MTHVTRRYPTDFSFIDLSHDVEPTLMAYGGDHLLDINEGGVDPRAVKTLHLTQDEYDNYIEQRLPYANLKAPMGSAKQLAEYTTLVDYLLSLHRIKVVDIGTYEAATSAGKYGILRAWETAVADYQPVKQASIDELKRRNCAAI